ncbi:MAG: peptidase M13, partial [Chthoniobacterales bacterium]
MKRSFLLVALVCSVSFAIAAEKKAKPSSAAQKSEANANNPQYGKWGFDSAGADFKAKAGDDFFRYANGTWLDHTQIPPDKSAYSLRLAMTDRTEQRLHEIMEDAAKKSEPTPSTIEGKVGAFYKSFMDEAGVEKAGATPVKQKIDGLRTINDRVALGAAMGRQNS